MKRKLLVEITYRGVVEVETTKENYDDFVASILPCLGLYGGCSGGGGGTYSYQKMEYVNGTYKEIKE